MMMEPGVYKQNLGRQSDEGFVFEEHAVVMCKPAREKGLREGVSLTRVLTRLVLSPGPPGNYMHVASQIVAR
jgi:hypothetical protein